jgi:hypothetical protein
LVEFFYFLFFIYLFFKDDGSVFSFGNNGSGSLGIRSTTNQSSPQKIKFENDEKIDKIFSGCNCEGCFFYSRLNFILFFYLFKIIFFKFFSIFYFFFILFFFF